MKRERKPRSRPALYLGAILTPRESGGTEFLPDGGLLVDDAGVILDIGPGPILTQNHPHTRRVRLGRGSLVIPGLVDAHTHLPQYGGAGRFDLELLGWLEREIFPLEARFAEADVARSSSRRFFAEMVRSGTTTAAVYTTVHATATEAAFRAARKAGIRAVIGKVMMDANAPDSLLERTDRSLRESRTLCARWNGAAGGRLRYAFTPRFALTCSRKLMKGVAELAGRFDARVQTHLAEARQEVQAVRRMFPDAKNYTDVYAQCGLVSPRTVFAHAIHLSRPELAALSAASAGIAHCPLSNVSLGSGLMDANARLDMGIPLGLGSDVAGGPTLDMFRQMGAACYTSKAAQLCLDPSRTGRKHRRLVTPEIALRMATIGGARVLGLERRVGSLEPGKYADFLVLDFAGIDPETKPPEERSMNDILSLLCYRGGAHAVRQTLVGGHPLVEEKEGSALAA